MGRTPMNRARSSATRRALVQGEGKVDLGREAALRDYRIMVRSRQASLLGRKEVFVGKAKFGIFGDGKEAAQVAMARSFVDGDFRSGYYRDQTFMFATGMSSVEEFFAQLYANPDLDAEPASAGRQMTAHFATRSLDDRGRWKRLTEMRNSSADVSPTGSQMPRLVGLGYASRLYREIEALKRFPEFSRNGDEVVFGTIGNASCAEGLFWESVNAIGILGGPVVLAVWDDGYGISVPNELQLTKGDLTELLLGFRRSTDSSAGFDVQRVRGWDYPALCEAFARATELARREHVPSILHVVEMTQPQGHSTSGSHERYKDAARLSWEEEFDPLRKTREWLLRERLAEADELDELEEQDRKAVADLREKAWDAFVAPIRRERDELVTELELVSTGRPTVQAIADGLRKAPSPLRRDLMRTVLDALVALRGEPSRERAGLLAWRSRLDRVQDERYSSGLHSRSTEAALDVPAVPPTYGATAEVLRGFELLNRFFDLALARDPRVIAFGEDVGKLGDVNQGFAGLQEKHGELRVSDTGIREATIVGQAIGMAMRGLRPIAEIQYLDYVPYALQIMSDDLATVTYRTRGGQKAPVIVRTRGHRLEGIWHSGSPMAGILNLVRGIYVCVPRDMTRAAGMYNTLLSGDDPAIVVEVLNGYRLKERLPDNLADATVPLGVPERLREGTDVTIVTYGACCRIALDAADLLGTVGIDVEILDVQTLLPFDRPGAISESLRKTSRVVFLDEDVPGGASAYMMQQVVDAQGGFWTLDSAPLCVSAKAHRPAYGSDGDYWSKPQREHVFEAVYGLMRESAPRRFPELF